MQASLRINAAVTDIAEPAPTVVVKENIDGTVSEVFLVSEMEVLGKVPVEKAPLYLLAIKVPTIVSSVLSCINSA